MIFGMELNSIEKNQYGFTPEQESKIQKLLDDFQVNYTFKRDCKHCTGRGHTGRFLTGTKRGLYIPCRCAKKKTDS